MNYLLVIGCLMTLLQAKCPRKSYDVSPNPGPSIIGKGPDCGPKSGGMSCKGNPDGPCCSSLGYCGSSFIHCSAKAGCQGGPCTKANPKNYSINGRCGPKFTNTICPPGTEVGECCSPEGYCGKTEAHCKKY